MSRHLECGDNRMSRLLGGKLLQIELGGFPEVVDGRLDRLALAGRADFDALGHVPLPLAANDCGIEHLAFP